MAINLFLQCFETELMIYSVNNAIKQLDILRNKPVLVTGTLSFLFEDVSLNHFPQKEYCNVLHSSLWIEIDRDILKFDRRVMKKWHTKKIIVEGILYKADSFFGGTGHMCLWSASIIATEITLLKDSTISKIG